MHRLWFYKRQHASQHPRQSFRITLYNRLPVHHRFGQQKRYICGPEYGYIYMFDVGFISIISIGKYCSDNGGWLGNCSSSLPGLNWIQKLLSFHLSFILVIFNFSLLILSSLVYPVTLLRKRISAASMPVMSLHVVTHVSLPYSSDGLATNFIKFSFVFLYGFL